MSSHNNQLTWGTEEHPTLEELRQYQEDALPSALSQELEQHLLSCDVCTDVVEGMMLADRASTRKAVHAINFRLQNLKQPKKKRRLPAMPLLDWRAAAAIVALLCSLALVVYYQYTQLAKDRPAAVTVAEQPVEISPATPAPASEELTQEAVAPLPAAVEPAPPLATARPQARTKPTQSTAPQPLHTLIFEDAPALAEANTDTQTDSAASQPPAASGSTLAATSARAAASRLAKAPESRKITGKVLSESGEGLPGVTVVIKGANTGASTDVNGHFTLPAPAESGTLVFNYIGYEPAETTVGPGTSMVQVNLFPSASALNEVVVVGYGTARAAEAAAPSPVGGTRAFNKYIKENLRYPDAAREGSVKGKVEVAFTVTPAGLPGNLRILKSLHPACDAEAIRLVKEGPSWKPATINGSPVSQEVKVSIRFKP
ncbi:energy transducer TonB [Pontibacter beigongshangensis]|uniref:energy transducer TonB n=1 Tax=Pontibacter beigongshangensis TaxID=2574733 RepID=UPI00164FF8AB|nr:energy transducer TonB [Pontibacter beigongshangensis]